MKPKHNEIRRILKLATVSWMDFLNELNNPLLSKSYLPDDSVFEQIYKETPLNEICEALILIALHWGRTPEQTIKLGILGLKFSKPHTVFETTIIANHKCVSCQKKCLKFVQEAIRGIDQIEFYLLFKIVDEIDINHPDEHQVVISKYNSDMMNLRAYPDPYIRAGIDLQLIRRGFVL